MENDYFEIQKLTNDMARQMSNTMDYEAGWMFADCVNTPTKYKGKGRPRITDYAIWKHPFDGRLERRINY